MLSKCAFFCPQAPCQGLAKPLITSHVATAPPDGDRREALEKCWAVPSPPLWPICHNWAASCWDSVLYGLPWPKASWAWARFGFVSLSKIGYVLPGFCCENCSQLHWLAVLPLQHQFYPWLTPLVLEVVSIFQRKVCTLAIFGERIFNLLQEMEQLTCSLFPEPWHFSWWQLQGTEILILLNVFTWVIERYLTKNPLLSHHEENSMQHCLGEAASLSSWVKGYVKKEPGFGWFLYLLGSQIKALLAVHHFLWSFFYFMLSWG